MPDWAKKLWRRKIDASLRSPSPATPHTLSGGGPKADKGDGVTESRGWWDRNGSAMLSSAQLACDIIESGLDGFPIYGPKAAFGAAAKALKALKTIKESAEKMDEIVEQTEMIASSLVACTLQVPDVFSSPPRDVVERVHQFNERLAKAQLTVTEDATTKRNILVRLRDAQQVFEQLESFWRKAQFAYNDLIAQTVVSTEVRVDRTEVKVDRIQHQLLLDRLVPITSAFCDSSEAAPACLPGTRIQLLADIQTWMDDPSTKPIYWLDGIAGTGKTTIAQSVAAIAAERLAASFFFSRTAESSGRRQTAPVIPTLAYQLAQKHKVVCSHVCSALELKPDIRTSRMEDQAHTLLSEPLAAVADGLFPLPLLVVLDGLDECDKDAGSGREGGQLISILLETFRGLPFCVKMFITSRPEPTVRNMFGEISEYTYRLALHRDIDEGVVHKDIKAYLRAELSKLAKKRSIPLPFPSDANFKTLADRAGTLFIYVRTVVEYISSDLGGSPQEQLTELLQLNVSAGSRTFASLDAVYTQTLQKALSAFGHSVAERQQFKDVLACLVLLRHSATVSDLAILTGTGQAGCAKVLRCLSSLLVYSHQAEEAIRVIHPSLADFLTDPGRCSYAEFMIGTTSRTKFASTLWECWKETENATYLEDAIRLDHGAVVLCPRGDPNRDAACSDVAFSLLRRYDHTRDATLLDEIITLDREALALHPEGHPDHAWSCANLATSLQRCYDRTGDITLLDEIITLEREALALHPEGHPDHAWSCENLANSLQRWYGHTGDITLLDEVIKLGREALALRPEGLSDHAWSFASLAVSLQICYDHTGDTALLDEVIKLAREALELRPAGHPDHAKACGNLAASLTRHFDYTGDISVLDEVIQLGREALALCPKGHPHYAIWRGNLAVCLRRRFDKTRDVALLDEITELEREAAAERSE